MKPEGPVTQRGSRNAEDLIGSLEAVSLQDLCGEWGEGLGFG